MELVMIECIICNHYFATKVETGEHRCPKCSEKNMRYIFDDSVTDEEIEIIGKIHSEIKDIFYNHGMDDISDIKILDLIVGK
ncbi:MAG: hypothetical protein RR835_12250 [Peptostreptococcaceae bacterium]